MARRTEKGSLCEVSGKPYFRELCCDPEDDDSVRATIVAMFPQSMSGRSLAVSKPAVCGITNQLRKVTPDGDEQCAMLVRCYGAAGMIDRDVETATFEALSLWLGRPAYLGRFANGRVEGWLHGYRTLLLDEMPLPAFYPNIAKAMAKLHNFTVPPHLQPHLSDVDVHEAGSSESAAVV